LAIFEKFFDWLSFGLIEVLIPVFEKDDFWDKVFAFLVFEQGLEHGVEDLFRVTLIHIVEESSRAEVNILKLIISIKPEGIQMRMKSDKELIILQVACGLRSRACYYKREQSTDK
jgi:hypothetical protein